MRYDPKIQTYSLGATDAFCKSVGCTQASFALASCLVHVGRSDDNCERRGIRAGSVAHYNRAPRSAFFPATICGMRWKGRRMNFGDMVLRCL